MNNKNNSNSKDYVEKRVASDYIMISNICSITATMADDDAAARLVSLGTCVITIRPRRRIIRGKQCQETVTSDGRTLRE